MLCDVLVWRVPYSAVHRTALAGIVRSAPFLEMSEEDFDAVLAVNLKGVFLTCQAVRGSPAMWYGPRTTG